MPGVIVTKLEDMEIVIQEVDVLLETVSALVAVERTLQCRLNHGSSPLARRRAREVRSYLGGPDVSRGAMFLERYYRILARTSTSSFAISISPAQTIEGGSRPLSWWPIFLDAELVGRRYDISMAMDARSVDLWSLKAAERQSARSSATRFSWTLIFTAVQKQLERGLEPTKSCSTQSSSIHAELLLNID
jgi:hypothetical protein